jgi:hypothetical protein
MPRSTVQFQKGLSLPSFLATYGTEEQCREALYRIRWPSGFCCPRCGHRSCFLIKTRMLYQCTGCRTQTSLMSGTVFGCSKLPLTIWFLAIFLITQSKNGISSLALSRSTGISPTAALRMKHKLQQAMKNHDDSLALSRVVQIDDAYWGGTRHDGLVGRGASGKTPFLAAVETNEDGHPIFMRLSRIAGFTSHEIGRWVKHHVIPFCVQDAFNIHFQPVKDWSASGEFSMRHRPSASCAMTASRQSNSLLANSFSRNSSQSRSAGFNSGEYGGKRTSAMLAGSSRSFERCEGAPSSTMIMNSRGYFRAI